MTSSNIGGVLASHHSQFLSFLIPRVGSKAAAEEVLQSAFVRALENSEELRDERRAVAWFYRLLRNALIDRARHANVEGRVLAPEAEGELVPEDARQLEDRVCACVTAFAATLKPEYAEVLRGVDLDERPIAEFAVEAGITPNNANVRLHRARKALAERLVEMCGTCCEHGCVDCECPNAPRMKIGL